MTGATREYDDRSLDSTLDVDAPSPPSQPLEAIVVRYQDGPDRCTITPKDCSDAERLTTWLSADLDLFVDATDAR